MLQLDASNNDFIATHNRYDLARCSLMLTVEPRLLEGISNFVGGRPAAR